MSRKLTLEETKKCLKAWRELHDEDALMLLMNSNAGLVYFWAKKRYHQTIAFDELLSAGNLGMFNAINHFDYMNGDMATFSSYLSLAISRQMEREIKKEAKHAHVLSLEEPVGHHKDGDEIHLEDLVGSDAEELLEDVIKKIKNEIVREALQSLTSQEQLIILLRYGVECPKTYREIGEMIGTSYTTVQNYERKALIKMRHPRNTRKLKDFA